jgi:hypothetical protein
MSKKPLLLALAAAATLGFTPGSAAADEGATHGYTVRLHQLNVSRTRAKYDDTLTVMIAAIVDEQKVAEQSVYLGNYGSSDTWPQRVLLSFQAADGAKVKIVTTIVNDHNPTDAASQTAKILDQISDYAEKYVNGVYPAGPVWPWVNSEIHTINSWFAGGCDGTVAADAMLTTGQGLSDGTANGLYYSAVQRHDGTNSPWYCGATSLYFTQYSISRDS